MIVLISFSELESSLFRKASEEVGIADHVRYIDNATADNIDVLHAQLVHAKKAYPKVMVINLDDKENDWRDILGALKSTEGWKNIPILGMSFSNSAELIEEFYAMRGASLIQKPDSYSELIDITQKALSYWMNVATLPNEVLNQYSA
jgi:DNA-binding NarL/FixJ family response regulator